MLTEGKKDEKWEDVERTDLYLIVDSDSTGHLGAHNRMSGNH